MISTWSATLFYATGFFLLAMLFLSDFKENMEVMITTFKI